MLKEDSQLTPMQELIAIWKEALASGTTIDITNPLESDVLGKVIGKVTALHVLGTTTGILISIDLERSELTDQGRAAINKVSESGLTPFMWISENGEQIKLLALRSETAEE